MQRTQYFTWDLPYATIVCSGKDNLVPIANFPVSVGLCCGPLARQQPAHSRYLVRISSRGSGIPDPRHYQFEQFSHLFATCHATGWDKLSSNVVLAGINDDEYGRTLPSMLDRKTPPYDTEAISSASRLTRALSRGRLDGGAW